MHAPAGMSRWVPGLALLRGAGSRRAGLRRDLPAGIVLAALLVPQGMAYAELAGLPPVTGLYATIVPLVVYFLLGPSRILILGPDSAVSPLVAAAIIPLAAGGDPSERVALAGILALMVGAVMFVGGLARFGFVTELLSMPVRMGYLMGIALTVIVAQLPKLFGFSIPTETLIPALRDFVAGLDETNATALALGVGSLVLILVLRRVAPRVPGVFLAVVGATAIVSVLGLADEVPVVGPVPSGLPAFGVPDVSLADLKTLIPAAIGIAFVAFADTSVLSRSYAGRLGQEVDQNQELAVLGVANVATGLFQGFPLSTSSSRTAVAEDVGARSQFAGLVGALVLAVLLLVGTGLVQDLPVVDARGDRHRRGPRVLRRARRGAAAPLAALGVPARDGRVRRRRAARRAVGRRDRDRALAPDFIRRAWRPHDAVLGRVDGMKGYHDTDRHPEARLIPGPDALPVRRPAVLRERRLLPRARARAREQAGGRWIVVAAEPITDVDATAGEMLGSLNAELDEAGIEIAFAELKDPVRDRLISYGIDDEIGRHRFWPTLGAAVSAYLAETGVEWVDWDHRKG